MRSIVLAISAAALAASVAAANPASNLPPQSGTPPAVHPHSGLHRMLTPEERVLYREQQRQTWRSLPPAQRCAKKQEMRQALATMPPAEMQKLKAQLDAEWNKLPAAQKQRIEQRIANRHERRAEGGSAPRGHGGSGGCRAGDI